MKAIHRLHPVAIVLCAAFALRAAAPVQAGDLARSSGRRWVLGVQPTVNAEVYRTPESYRARITEAVESALRRSSVAPGDAALVVLPEYVGTWLALLGESDAVYQAPDRKTAVNALIRGNLGFAGYLRDNAVRYGRTDPFEPGFVFLSLLHYKARSMWEAYRETGSRLAARNHLTLVAGSIVLPPLDSLDDPRAPLYNISVVFEPDGGILQATRKIFLTTEEKAFTSAGALEDIRTVETPVGRLGNMICADGWYAEVYQRLADADILVQPSLGEGGLAAFDQPWSGYSGAVNFPAVDKRDIENKTFTVRDAWRKYSLAGKIQLTRAVVGVNPFLSGKIWDVEFGGYGVAVDSRLPSGRQAVDVATGGAQDTFLQVEAP